ncbi:hypothetical protein [Flavobacterium collinsii]|uniref:PEP-CTERM protein-sorting domain-containing protein n=1 Tax=Flavobacterium collinsii TaxID=1114861 RepID=A0ABM8KNJ8_9FLAO|nr:hypothetical protein [Flavobacterium collinsii]CAA9202069.1 hypothetical protein FLACOL7796_04084 [Flavobacterium collinsii]
MKVKSLKLLVILLFISPDNIAAPSPPQPQPQSIPPPIGDPVPIDNEISILFLSGVILGAFFLNKKRTF